MFVSLEGGKRSYTIIVVERGKRGTNKRKATCDIFNVTLAEANGIGHLLADRLSCDFTLLRTGFTLLPYIEVEE